MIGKNTIIGIMGAGFVGGTLVEALKCNFKIIVYDPKIKEFEKNLILLSKCSIIFLAVPTPSKNSGEIDLEILKSALDSLKELKFKSKPIIVIRSTIVPGTTNSLSEIYPFNFVYNPEFLREKFALSDFLKTQRVIIGTDTEENFEIVRDIYKSFLSNAKYFLVNWKTAEMVKYSSNAFLASQVIIANEVYQICKILEIDYNFVKEVLSLDDRIAKNIQVPGPDGNLGFGGKCFPKDLNAITYLAKQKGYEPKFFEEVLNSNERFRKLK